MLLEEDNIVMKSHGKGKYGRVLGELFVKKENEYISINELLVKEGFAEEYFGGKR